LAITGVGTPVTTIDTDAADGEMNCGRRFSEVVAVEAFGIVSET
jgi:hypothetical protein